MLYDNEVITLILGTGVFFFVLFNRNKVRRIIFWRLLLFAFLFLMAGWLLTILEGFFLEYYFNVLEHFSYAASAVIMAFWCRKVALTKREEHES
jgi:hypothetical protein